MGYRWAYDPKGQYVDGHERADVVAFRNKIFLPAMEEFQDRTIKWNSKDGESYEPPEGVRRVL